MNGAIANRLLSVDHVKPKAHRNVPGPAPVARSPLCHRSSVSKDYRSRFLKGYSWSRIFSISAMSNWSVTANCHFRWFLTDLAAQPPYERRGEAIPAHPIPYSTLSVWLPRRFQRAKHRIRRHSSGSTPNILVALESPRAGGENGREASRRAWH